MKRPKPKTVQKIFLVVILIGVMIGAAGAMTDIMPVCCCGMGIIIVGMILHIMLYRCPHCDAYLNKSTGAYCPHCGRRINE